MSDLKIIQIEQKSKLLGRQVVHDERSRSFAMGLPIDRSLWRTKTIRLWDPFPNPEQVIGNCTGCQKAMAFNATGQRTVGIVHRMDWADSVYSLASANDPWEGAWPPEDTGSSGLAAAKAAQALGVGGEYRWLFGGADEVIQAVMEGWTVGVGTWWYEGGFRRDGTGRIEMTGEKVGGHQWTVRGYDKIKDHIIGRCWWGGFRDFRMKREHLNDLLMDDGDANVQAHI